jgi:hypothetical protein
MRVVGRPQMSAYDMRRRRYPDFLPLFLHLPYDRVRPRYGNDGDPLLTLVSHRLQPSNKTCRAAIVANQATRARCLIGEPSPRATPSYRNPHWVRYRDAAMKSLFAAAACLSCSIKVEIPFS